MFRKWQEARNEEGFTLIELLVVVIIIGILAAIAIPAFLNQRERAWQSELTSSVRNVALDVEAEATKFGGDYTRVGAATSGDVAAVGEFDTFVVAELNALQGADATPVVYNNASTAVTTNSFVICMEHVQLNDGTASTGSVTYDSANGGIQGFVEGPCT